MKKKIRKLLYILIAVSMLTSLTPAAAMTAAASATTNPTFSNVVIYPQSATTIRGETANGTTPGISAGTIEFIIVGTDFNFGPNLNVLSWFKNKPEGLISANMISYVPIATSATFGTLTVEISGIPETGKTGPIEIVVPKNHIVGATADVPVDRDPTVKWEIGPIHTVNFSVDGTGGSITSSIGLSGTGIQVGDNEKVTFTATPTTPTSTSPEKYVVEEWKNNGITVSEGLSTDKTKYTTTITGTGSTTVNIEVKFKQIPKEYVASPTQFPPDNTVLNVPTPSTPAGLKFSANMAINAQATDLTFTVGTDLQPSFDPTYDKDNYTFGVLSSNSSVITAEVTKDVDNTITLTPIAPGTATITVSVTYKTGGDNPPSISKGEYKFQIVVKPPNMLRVYDETADEMVLELTPADESGVALPGVETLSINFDKETISLKTAGKTIDGYSIDGGVNWVLFAANMTENGVTDISKMFDSLKEKSEVWFAESLSSSRKPEKGTTIWIAGNIKNRPAAPKTKVKYGQGDADVDKWALADSNWGVPNDLDKLSIAEIYKDGTKPAGKINTPKNPTPKNLEYIPADDIEVKPLGDKNGKMAVLKTDYYVRYSPVASEDLDADGITPKSFTPASKHQKLTVSGQLKPTTLKIDYKKEVVFPKANIGYKYGVQSGLMAKDKVKEGISFEKIKGTNETSTVKFEYWIEATDKKPRSASVEAYILGYTTWDSVSGDTAALLSGWNDSKYTYKLPKGYEVEIKKPGVPAKWATSVKIDKNINGDQKFTIRKKGNVKYKFNSTTGKIEYSSNTETVSTSAELIITWGEYTIDKSNGKTTTKKGVKDVKVN